MNGVSKLPGHKMSDSGARRVGFGMESPGVCPGARQLPWLRHCADKCTHLGTPGMAKARLGSRGRRVPVAGAWSPKRAIGNCEGRVCKLQQQPAK